jgi:hypothetical protein
MTNEELLNAALEGLGHQLLEINNKKAWLLDYIEGNCDLPGFPIVKSAPPKAKRKMSAAGRKAIAAAQKKRWAKIHAARARWAKNHPSKKAGRK